MVGINGYEFILLAIIAVVILGPERLPEYASQLARLVREEAGVISDVDVLAVLRQLRHDTAGAGRLEPLLALDGVTDVLQHLVRVDDVEAVVGEVECVGIANHEVDVHHTAVPSQG